MEQNMETKLPSHLITIIDNPAKRAMLNNFLKVKALKSLERGDKIVFSKVNPLTYLCTDRVFLVEDITDKSIYFRDTQNYGATSVRFDSFDISDAEFRKV